MDTTSLFKQRSARPITYQEAHDELMGAYDRTLGLETGLHQVGFSEFENPIFGSLYDIWYATFLREQVGEHYKMDIDRFLDRPRWEILLMLDNIRRRNAAINQAGNGLVGARALELLEKEAMGQGNK
ncbi:hypothetical protein pEaSNUABM29_00122 [Erwinia phage pEa_SNUABM_29]|nr:hypothetical protein pEaSNUABM29_00122 [Erwinia phage pEa_SNUABM_29]